MPRLSIIIVTFNSRGQIDACLQSLVDGVGVDREIVVVDNASSDGTTTHLRERWPGVRVIDAGGNVGFARACNIGIRQTFGDLVLLLNPDTTVMPGAIDRLVSALDDDSTVGVVGPRIVDADGRAELSFGRMVGPVAELRQKALMAINTHRVPVLRAIVDQMTRRTKEVDWVTGACLLAWRRDLDAVGLLDERFFLYLEDVDLCASIRGRGRRVLFLADAEIRHQRGASASPLEREAAYRRSYIAFYEKHHPGWLPAVRLYVRLFHRSGSA